jgi:hypothetical protein
MLEGVVCTTLETLIPFVMSFWYELSPVFKSVRFLFPLLFIVFVGFLLATLESLFRVCAEYIRVDVLPLCQTVSLRIKNTVLVVFVVLFF